MLTAAYLCPPKIYRLRWTMQWNIGCPLLHGLMASNPSLHLLLSKFFIHRPCFTLTPRHEFTIHATQHNDTSLSLACLRAVLAYMSIKFKRQMGRKIGPTCHRQGHGACEAWSRYEHITGQRVMGASLWVTEVWPYHTLGGPSPSLRGSAS